MSEWASAIQAIGLGVMALGVGSFQLKKTQQHTNCAVV